MPALVTDKFTIATLKAEFRYVILSLISVNTEFLSAILEL